MDGGPYHMDWFLYDRDFRHEKVNHELDIYHRGVYRTWTSRTEPFCEINS